MKKRLDYIDIAKGIAIIYVVLSHISISFLAKHVSSFYMPFFFFLSGLVYNEKIYNNYYKLIEKKISLLKIYFSASGLLLLMYFFLNKINKNELIRVVFGIFYSRYYINKSSSISLLSISNNALWFLPSLFLVFILYFGICKISKCKIDKVKYSVFLSIIGIVLNKCCTFLFPWNLDTSLICTIFFCLGDVLKEKIEKRYKKYNIKEDFVIFLIMIILNLFSIKINGMINLSIGVYSNYLLFFLGASSGIGLYLIISIFISKFIPILNRLLVYVGKQSLTIMLYHMVVINLLLIPGYYKYLNTILLYRGSLMFGLVSTFNVIVFILLVDCLKKKIFNNVKKFLNRLF